MLSVAIPKKSTINIYIRYYFNTFKKDYFNLKDQEAFYIMEIFL